MDHFTLRKLFKEQKQKKNLTATKWTQKIRKKGFLKKNSKDIVLSQNFLSYMSFLTSYASWYPAYGFASVSAGL